MVIAKNGPSDFRVRLEWPVKAGSGLWAWFPKAVAAKNRLGGERIARDRYRS